jgi:transposase-like protein
MPAKKPPAGTDADLNLAELSELFINEDAARSFIEARVWPNGPICPHCGSVEAYVLCGKEGSKNPVRKGVYKCKSCRKQFTVRIGTIFEDSKLPFTKWLITIHLMTSSKKGISSLQISRELGITVKSAWFMTQRIREAMRPDNADIGQLDGIVEVDETYVGGKPRKGDGKTHKRGRGTAKTPVMVLVERNGSARAFPLENVTSKTLKSEIKKHVDNDALLMTDELPSYIGSRDDETHRTVCHSSGEYSRTDDDGIHVHTNTAESYFALLKRGHYGVFHQLSKKHLHRYCNEFSFRWSLRKVSDGERMTEAIKGVKGKRLMYRATDSSI